MNSSQQVTVINKKNSQKSGTLLMHGSSLGKKKIKFTEYVHLAVGYREPCSLAFI